VVKAAGLVVAGLGGSIRYRPGPNQYTQREMCVRALRLELRARVRQALTGKRVDVLLTHSPPRGCGDSDDPAHRGFDALTRLIHRLEPIVAIHGHVTRFGPPQADRQLGRTRLVNAIPYRLLELPGATSG
jgi:Icc-related predicted phosphoesterase